VSKRLLIFDLDGVITSEADYWRTAGEGVGSEIPLDFIYWVKNHAVNHNWDLAFLAASARSDYSAFRQTHEQLTGKDLLAACPGYRGPVWQDIHQACQRIQDTRLPVEVLLDAKPMFETLKADYAFGVATGRPRPEALAPLAHAGILDYFDPARIVTHDDVVEAERTHPGQSFGKPDPFIVHKAMRADFRADQTIFVGDTLSDIQAAARAGVRSIGILTALPPGPHRELRRKTLAEAGCTTILDSVLEIPGALR
jgi:phosphoglycolate phosphatase-like HAD superfamily hydrolase